jgi:hypothetical protein
MKIKAEKEFWSGLMFLAFAVVAIVMSRGYSLGRAGQMGPGYFPLALGVLLAFLGAITISQSFVKEGEKLDALRLGPLLTIALSVVLFGLLIEVAGLVISVALVIAILGIGLRSATWLELTALTVGLIVFAIAVFVFALQLPLPIWPTV